MARDILVIPDQHAHPDFHNERADWLGELIADLKPEVVVNIGDAADMPSLSSYDRGKRSYHGRAYAKDINAHLDFQDRMWNPVKKAKKKMPYSVVFEGNHEHRIEKVLDLNPEMEGTVSFNDFQFDVYYDDIIRYVGGTPGSHVIDGITFAHYLVSGIKGLPISGEHPGHALVTKRLTSCVVGHSHLRDEALRISDDGRHIQGLVAGCYQDYDAPWAGNQNKFWWRGVVLLEDAENGRFDPRWISLDRIKKAYSNG